MRYFKKIIWKFQTLLASQTPIPATFLFIKFFFFFAIKVSWNSHWNPLNTLTFNLIWSQFALNYQFFFFKFYFCFCVSQLNRSTLFAKIISNVLRLLCWDSRFSAYIGSYLVWKNPNFFYFQRSFDHTKLFSASKRWLICLIWNLGRRF